MRDSMRRRQLDGKVTTGAQIAVSKTDSALKNLLRRLSGRAQYPLFRGDRRAVEVSQSFHISRCWKVTSFTYSPKSLED